MTSNVLLKHEKKIGKHGEEIETTMMSDSFLHWKRHVETCVTKKHHRYNDLNKVSCTLYFQFFDTPFRWSITTFTYVYRPTIT